MPDYYYFFFSYARLSHGTAKGNLGNTCNYLDEFFDALCRKVSALSGQPLDAVAYRDKSALKASEFWDPSLVEGLQKSRVLLSVLSPHYLKSQYCRRELAFFHKRFGEHVRQSGDASQAHRILPLFWQDMMHCDKHAGPYLKEFLKSLSYSQPGIPEDYHLMGVEQMCRLGRHKDAVEDLCHSLAMRIVEIAEDLPPMPPLPSPLSLGSLENIEELLAREGAHHTIFSGPTGANVVYFVGTRAQMATSGTVPSNSYADVREKWCPFSHSGGETVEILTREGAQQAGLSGLNNLGLPESLTPLLDKAKEKNSPLLFVLDRPALAVREIRERMSEYDSTNYGNCGLVTVGGGATDTMVKEVFKYKCAPNYLHHVWKIPNGRQEYVDSVASVLSGIQRQLMSQGKSDTTFGRSDVPGLSAPSGG
jgi:hypothetical protein